MNVKPYAKAAVALAIPVATGLVAALTDESLGGTRITPYEWASAGLAGLLTAATVFGVPNERSKSDENEFDGSLDDPSLF